jgi:hypothetical protein
MQAIALYLVLATVRADLFKQKKSRVSCFTLYSVKDISNYLEKVGFL